MLKRFLAPFSSTPSIKEPQPDTGGAPAESDLSKEDEERYIKLVELSKIKCRFAEGSLEGIDGSGSEDDIYEQERVEKLLGAALGHAAEIPDEFYKCAALHPIADLLSKAGRFDEASEIISQISVEFIQEKAGGVFDSEKSIDR